MAAYNWNWNWNQVLEWLRRKGCPWNEQACAEAALGGHLEVLKWLHKKGCPFDDGVREYAARGGHLEVLEWLHEHGWFHPPGQHMVKNHDRGQFICC